MSYYKDKSIKEWALEDRPREKLRYKGAASLTDAELIAILISSGTKSLSAIDVARTLMEKFKLLNNLAQASSKELTEINGIGQAKAMTIMAAFELAKRKEGESDKKLQVTCSRDIARYMTPKIANEPCEVLYALFLNKRNMVVAEKELSRGGIASTIMDVRIILKEALLHAATGIVLIHNHPSGNSTPSPNDHVHTKKLHAAAKTIDIQLLDHVIVCRDGYYSFSDHDEI